MVGKNRGRAGGHNAGRAGRCLPGRDGVSSAWAGGSVRSCLRNASSSRRGATRPDALQAMTTIAILMPQLGESVSEGTIARWLVKPGDKLVEFAPMLEVDTDKVSAEVPAPFSGVLTKILAQEGDTVVVGAEIALAESDQTTQEVTPPPTTPPAAAGRADARPGGHSSPPVPTLARDHRIRR